VCLGYVEDVLLQIGLCAFRKDVFQQLKHLRKKEYVEEALAGGVLAECEPPCFAAPASPGASRDGKTTHCAKR
jgi:hypothetical protein